MRTILAIAVMGAAGAVSRHLLGSFAKAHIDTVLPVGTIAVNVIGSFLLGLLTALAVAGVVPESWRGPVAIGFLGAFTTFSTFGVETVALAQDGRLAAALANVAVQLVVGFGAAAAGLWVGRLAGA